MLALTSALLCAFLGTGCERGERLARSDTPVLEISAVNEFLSANPTKREVQERFGPCDGASDESGKSAECIYVLRMNPLIPAALYVPVGLNVFFTNDVANRWTIIFSNEGETSGPVASGGIANGSLEMRLVSTNSVFHDGSSILKIPNVVIQTVHFRGESQGTLAIEFRLLHLGDIGATVRTYQGQRARIYINGEFLGTIRLDPDLLQGSRIRGRFEPPNPPLALSREAWGSVDHS